MQEEVENRTVSLVVSTTRLSTRVLMQAIEKHLNKAERKKENIKAEKRQVRVAGKSEEARLRAQRKEAGPHGKQSVRQLMRSGKATLSFATAIVPTGRTCPRVLCRSAPS